MIDTAAQQIIGFDPLRVHLVWRCPFGERTSIFVHVDASQFVDHGGDGRQDGYAKVIHTGFFTPEEQRVTSIYVICAVSGETIGACRYGDNR